MKLDRVHDLVKEYGYSIHPSGVYGYELYSPYGEYVDTLHSKQIEELQEVDFIEYYLQD